MTEPTSQTAAVPPPVPPAAPDGLEQLRELIRNPAARVYLAVAGGALVLLCFIVFQLYFSAVGTAAIFALGLLGLLLKWTAVPVLIVVIIGYITVAPLGVPIFEAMPPMVPGSQFAFRDLLLLPTLLTYLLAQFRLFSVLHTAVPFEAAPQFLRKRVKAAVRPPQPITDAELSGLFIRAGVFTLVGQMLWALITWVVVDFREVPPFRVLEEDSTLVFTQQRLQFGMVPPQASRCLLAAGLFVVLGLLVRMVFWFWRHATLGREQAKLLLTDLRWAEHRREIDRQESWRAWMVAKQNGTLPKRGGCGTFFLVIGLPALLLLVYWLLMMAGGCVRT